MPTKLKKGIVILSGGVDSTTLLWEYRHDIALALSYDYGSRHNEREIACARWQAEQAGIEHLVIPLSFIAQYFRSDLLKSGGEIKLGSYSSENIASTVVPFRNGIMLAIAAGLAESRKLSQLYLANHFGDHALYPDCTAAFIEGMKAAILHGTTCQVEVCAPYTHLDKKEIVRRGLALGVDYAHTYSCYQGEELHCGQCATCIERQEAFLYNGVKDPQSYR